MSLPGNPGRDVTKLLTFGVFLGQESNNQLKYGTSEQCSERGMSDRKVYAKTPGNIWLLINSHANLWEIKLVFICVCRGLIRREIGPWRRILPHRGLRRGFRALSARVSVSISVGTPLCPYGLPTVGS